MDWCSPRRSCNRNVPVKQVDNMAVDALAPWVDKSSTTMELKTLNERILVYHKTYYNYLHHRNIEK